MKKLGIYLVVALVMGAGGYGGWRWWQGQRTALEDKGGPVLTAQVGKQTIDITVEISGDLEPIDVLEVKSEVSAKIKKLHVELGDTVKQGALLVELDDKELQTEKSSVLIEIAGAKLSADKARADHARDQKLYERQLIPEKTLADTRSAMDLADNALDRASKRLQTIEERLSKTQILAPMNGVILELPVVEGQVVVAAASVNSGTMIMKMAKLEQLLIKSHVNQVDVARLKPGMEVKFSVDSIPGVEMGGRIDRLAPTATVKNNIKGFQVEIRIEHPDERLRPGMTADVVVPISRVENVVAVPLTAVFSEPDGSRVVFVQPPVAGSESPPETRPVEIGVSNIHFVEIKKGLQENETVLLARPLAKPSGG
ncbi:MAG: efflux RND transporter periplasmic adaptor subunit [Candidatus Methylacidiphilales bacterium]|nr:efflux RND transporter periplasmic adaptor subunit [Candidatus Methylacidiphilales bacterium]